MKVGILGAGNIANQMAEAVCGLRGKQVEAYAVASRDHARAKAFADKYGIKKAYGSYEELVNDGEVDLIYVATPHSHHYEHMKLCLNHGKAVLCEKAFTVNAAQAREICALSEEKGILAAEAIWTRYMPSRKMIDEIIADGAIGKVRSLSANLCYVIHHVPRLKDPALAGGALLDVGVYTLNFASMVFGDDIKTMASAAVLTDAGVDEQNSIILTYEDGRMAYLYSGMSVQSDREGIINGDKGYIKVQNINNCEYIRVYGLDRELKAEYKVPEQINGYEYEVLACQEALKNGAVECPQMPHSETIRIMEWMDELRASWGVVYPCE
ncbi:Gfo/Idh/MocA family protein [Qiania dongpingensis]|uniref:Gfo/Idh/MocA family oxidoreductase n=1 Tax=Qiania dongpingensis TaxID=2763669 RepID=A0A7G9G4X4_9FIRM|nr:Gfo/Idh/MocA family oxidoreductase [Qiania dongpingensis]QNM05856.1 Gfo/Idh/MocA family oxidoreductase [Qiania dongpingensis]